MIVRTHVSILHDTTRGTILLSDSNGQRVLLTLDPATGLYAYSSRAESDRVFIPAESNSPLCLAWHHAMVFFGVIDPDSVSHPPLDLMES